MNHCTRSIITLHVQIISNTESVNLFLSKNVSVLLREGLESNKKRKAWASSNVRYSLYGTRNVHHTRRFFPSVGWRGSLRQQSAQDVPSHGLQVRNISWPKSWLPNMPCLVFLLMGAIYNLQLPSVIAFYTWTISCPMFTRGLQFYTFLEFQ